MAETNKGIYYPTFAEVGEETYDGPVKMKMMAESIDPLLLSDEDKTTLEMASPSRILFVALAMSAWRPRVTSLPA